MLSRWTKTRCSTLCPTRKPTHLSLIHIYRDTTVQNVRHALLTWKAEFFADAVHGTDYERILGVNQNDVDEEEIKEIMREAIFQEPDVSRIDSMTVSYDGRSVSVAFTATLVNKETITLEVTA